jgi:ABC-type dipeptide/oligopeptide/nickel transport system permease subunit
MTTRAGPSNSRDDSLTPPSSPRPAGLTSTDSVPAIFAPPRGRDNPLTRSTVGLLGIAVLASMFLACLLSLPWTTGLVSMPTAADSDAAQRAPSVPRYNAGATSAARLPPVWATPNDDQFRRLNALVPDSIVEPIARASDVTPAQARAATSGPIAEALREHHPSWLLGTDSLGRSLLVRVLAGGGISLTIGLAAALLSVFIGTMYGALAGYAGGRVDAIMMRIVDVLYGLPYVLLVVLLAVAGDALVDEYTTRAKARSEFIRDNAALVLKQQGQPQAFTDVERLLATDPTLRQRLEDQASENFPSRNLSSGQRMRLDVATLLIAIGGVSWLTMARVIRGQVLSLKNLPFVEAARAMGASRRRIFFRHLLPNLAGPIIVYATLTVPQAILQESFLSFLGIGVKPPLPSWGNLAAEGLSELNPIQSNWWLLVFPCLLLSVTLLALNFVGEGLREALDPKRARA